MRTALAATIILVFVCSAPAIADEVRILSSPGGQVGPFLDLFEGVRMTGDRVVIDGPCMSACTLVLSVVPNDRICVTRRAVLGFHAARSIDRHNRLMLSRKRLNTCLSLTRCLFATGFFGMAA
jgi:hypothetical protein